MGMGVSEWVWTRKFMAVNNAATVFWDFTGDKTKPHPHHPAFRERGRGQQQWPT